MPKTVSKNQERRRDRSIMITKEVFEDILCKYPELIEPGYSVKGRHTELYGQRIDILLVDEYGKRLAVQVRVTPIENEHVGEIVSPLEYLTLSSVYASALGLPSDKKARKSVSRSKRMKDTMEAIFRIATNAMMSLEWS